MRISRVRLLFVALPLAAALTGCGGPQIPPAQNYGTIAGRAFDTKTSQPVAGVVVTVDTILNATTGSDGTYKIINVPPGSFSLRPQPPQGYTAPVQGQYDGSIGTGQNITIDIPVTKQ